jgi:hypothetical protein
MIWWILLAIHGICCILIYILKKSKKLYSTDLVMPIIVFIPFWGALSFILKEYLLRRDKQATKIIGIHTKKKLDKKFEHIDMDDSDHKTTAPLEEVIHISDEKTRRSLMLEILHKNPSEYLWMLQRASHSSDIEITHYATTTIMEIQSDYEKKLHDYERKLQIEPEESNIMLEYAELIMDYIGSGLVTGNILIIFRRQLAELLTKLSHQFPSNKKICFSCIENDLELKRIKRAAVLLGQAKQLWPEDEKVYMLYVSYYWQLQKGQEIQKILKQIKDSNIYLSRAGKEWFQFWFKGETL